MLRTFGAGASAHQRFSSHTSASVPTTIRYQANGAKPWRATMAGATAYALYKDRALLSADDLGMIAIGFGAAFIVALLVVKAFVAIVARHGFAPFAWYRIVVGTLALVWLLNR